MTDAAKIAVTSGNAMSPCRVSVRDLRPGDQILDERYLGGRCTVNTVTAELGRDLEPWWAVRIVGGSIIPADSLDQTFPLATAAGHRAAPASAAAEPFTPPKAMRELIELAHHHRRDYLVAHDTANSGEPFVRLRLRWLPDGCDIATEVTLTWHTFQTGTYRLFQAAAQGYRHGHHRITLTTARRLVSGAVCFHRDSGRT
ncbi:hypothetical protein IU436_29220 [Nocardia farcinica]|uniref:hypothetical protein n=1 Tax=Nocardia farcinica TaxID=37329 RepID=UPI00189621B6|nr:hypothetical protein [Nocardia farcinica]MBF6422952.1 hypothetical protein [Nocardia farcinica]MBF6434407.1 hypothetical protein [Nocardia farcinica]MBF6505475.1 hypothetical protein [Nocardia farcinica]